MAALTEEQAKRATELRARRWSNQSLAKHLKVPVEDLQAFFGVKPQNYAVLTSDDKANIRAMYAEGATRNVICKRYGIARKRLDRIILGVRRGQPVPALGEEISGKDLGAVEIPAWVPASLTDLYYNLAARDGEEAAASACRKLKANGALRHVTPSRLPATVSPAGY